MVFNSKSKKIIFYITPTLLFSLLPLFLITGSFLPDLSISLIGILFLIYCFKEKKFFYFQNKFFYIFLVFWVYLVINSLFNNFNLDSFKISIFYIRYGVFVIAIIALLNVDDKFVKYFFYNIFICFVCLIIDGFYQYFFGANLVGLQLHNTNRVSSFFGDELILGSYLSRLWPIFFGISLIIIKKKELFYLLVLTFILSEVLIFLSGERSAFFYINLSAIFVFLFSKKLRKLRFTIMIVSLSLIILVSIINPSAKERIIDKTINEMNLSDSIENQKIHIFSNVHTQYYLSAYKMFLDNKIFGVGVKNFRNFCDKDNYKSEFSCSNHPHNTYVQILSETGIIGFLFALIVIVYFCKNLVIHLNLKFKKQTYFTDFEICILSGVVIYLWPFIPTGSLFNNWLNIMMILNLPFLIWKDRLQNR
jgi:O-antigen ligase